MDHFGGWILAQRTGPGLQVKRRTDLAPGETFLEATPAVTQGIRDGLALSGRTVVDLYANILGMDPAQAARLDPLRMSEQAADEVVKAFLAGQLVVVASNGSLRILSPAQNAQLAIDATPAMPAIDLEVAIGGLQVDPTPQTTFQWTAQLRFNPAGVCRHGPNRNFALDLNGTHVGSPIPIRFSTLMGGDLTINVTASVQSVNLSAPPLNLRIAATNPSRADIQGAIANDTLQRIATHESQQVQFAGSPGAVVRCPLWSGDNLGGVGIFQITVPRPTDAQVWDWRQNVAAGRQRLEQGRATARAYRGQILRSHTWTNLTGQFNQGRRAANLPEVQIDIPVYTTDQVEDDAIRAFNGFGSNRDQFGFALREFRLRMDGAALHVTVDEATRRGMTEWERVPGTAAARGSSGDPNYVNNVHASSP
jgi:hypothetical protein